MSKLQAYGKRREDASSRRRAEVLKCAGLCFSEIGFKTTTTTLIAERAGVSKGLVFHLFGSKRGLFTSVVEDCLKQWSLLSEFRVSETDGHVISELRSLFIASFDFIEQNPILALISSKDEMLLQDYNKEFSRKNNRWRTRLRKTIERGKANGEIMDDIDATRLSEIFHDFQTTLIRKASTEDRAKRYDRASINLAIDIILRGIQV